MNVAEMLEAAEGPASGPDRVAELESALAVARDEAARWRELAMMTVEHRILARENQELRARVK